MSPSHRGPNLSIITPMSGAVTPLTTSRNVIARDSAPRLQPISSLIGAMKNENTTGFSGDVAMLIARAVATITQP